MKGQIPIFESVLLFTVGIAIFVICSVVFAIYQATWTDISEGQQLEQIGLYISAAIHTLAQNPANSSLMLAIPRQVGGTFYSIALNNQSKQLNVSTQKKTYTFELDRQLEFFGTQSSTAGQILLKKEKNKIFII